MRWKTTCCWPRSSRASSPLPHQLHASNRALYGSGKGERIRYLLADEVGPGKTIDARYREVNRKTNISSPYGSASRFRLAWIQD